MHLYILHGLPVFLGLPRQLRTVSTKSEGHCRSLQPGSSTQDLLRDHAARNLEKLDDEWRQDMLVYQPQTWDKVAPKPVTGNDEQSGSLPNVASGFYKPCVGGCLRGDTKW